MDEFDINKKNAMKKFDELDKSKKGCVDAWIAPIVESINSKEDFFTTSSCAGRIMVITPNSKKHCCTWHFSSHDPVKVDEIRDCINSISKDNKVTAYFRMEAPILHISCRNLKKAGWLLDLANKAGLRRAGIISLKKNIVEIFSTERIDAPVLAEGKVLVTEDYLKLLVEEANRKLKESRKKIKKFISLSEKERYKDEDQHEDNSDPNNQQQ